MAGTVQRRRYANDIFISVFSVRYDYFQFLIVESDIYNTLQLI